jgi:hypothetical protein
MNLPPAPSAQGLSSGGWPALPIPAAAESWRQRAAWLHAAEVAATGSSTLPDLSTHALLENLEKWLGPHLAGVRNSNQLQKLPWKDILKNQVGFGGEGGGGGGDCSGRPGCCTLPYLSTQAL